MIGISRMSNVDGNNVCFFFIERIVRDCFVFFIIRKYILTFKSIILHPFLKCVILF